MIKVNAILVILFTLIGTILFSILDTEHILQNIIGSFIGSILSVCLVSTIMWVQKINSALKTLREKHIA